LFSNIPSYLRVANASNQLSFCIDDEDWAAAFDSLINSRQQLVSGDEERRTYMRQFHTHEILMKKWSDVITRLAQKVPLNLDSHINVTRKPPRRKSTL